MSDSSQGEGWWQASDGKWYPPHLHPNTPWFAVPPQPSPPVASLASPESKPFWRRWQLIVPAAIFGGLVVLSALGSLVEPPEEVGESPTIDLGEVFSLDQSSGDESAQVSPSTTEVAATTTAPVESAPATSVALPPGIEMPNGDVVGGQLLITSDQDGDDEIYVMNLDGSDARQLTNNNDVDASPAWSPDGSKIVYSSESGTDDRTSKVLVMNADGSGVMQLVEDRHALSGEKSPTWMLDGARISFVSHKVVMAESAEYTANRDEWMSCYLAEEDDSLCDPILNRFITPQMFVAGVDGSDPMQVTQNLDLAGYQNMSWSPDGSQVAFTRRGGNDNEIFAMNADGSNVRQLTDNNDVDESPVWSPDGTRIAFANDRFGDYRILVMAADGTDVQELTDDGGQDWSPIWSPDGKHIAFASTRCITSICTPLDVLSTLSGLGSQIFIVDVESKELVPTFEEGLPTDWR